MDLGRWRHYQQRCLGSAAAIIKYGDFQKILCWAPLHSYPRVEPAIYLRNFCVAKIAL